MYMLRTTSPWCVRSPARLAAAGRRMSATVTGGWQTWPAHCPTGTGVSEMDITRGDGDTTRAPADYFTGDVHVDTIIVPTPPSRLRAVVVHFAPGARTAWHTHPLGQTIYVTDGVCWCQRRGGEIEEIRAGERVYFEPGEEHWHGAAPTRFMSHIAMHETDDAGSHVSWGGLVSDEEYAASGD